MEINSIKKRMGLLRQLCAIIHNKDHCGVCKKTYLATITCEEWKEMEDVKQKIIEVIVKRIKSL